MPLLWPVTRIVFSIALRKIQFQVCGNAWIHSVVMFSFTNCFYSNDLLADGSFQDSDRERGL